MSVVADFVATPAQAGLLEDVLGGIGKGSQGQNSQEGVGTGIGAGQLSETEMTGGLKDALAKAVQETIARLGTPNGYLTSELARIALPEKVQVVAKGLRAAGRGDLVDEFEASMNRAAGLAVAETGDIFSASIRQMRIQDARDIVFGPPDAATRFFQRTSSNDLATRIKPIVQKATAEARVTSAYKDMLGQAGPAAGLLGGGALDLDSYVTSEALDGLFAVMAQEEQVIRENPAQRTTSLMQRVFGAAEAE
jgi:hypothetical protein